MIDEPTEKENIYLNDVQEVTVGTGTLNDGSFASIAKAMGLPKDVPIQFIACRLENGKDFTATGVFPGRDGDMSSIEHLKVLTAWMSHMFFTLSGQVLNVMKGEPE